MRGRGQALFTVIGYGVGGVLGVLVGGLLVSQWGYRGMYAASLGLALVATVCAWKAHKAGLQARR